ncbi:MAG: hypothetical protein U0670_18165 [Anaerolineae bacterium]
MPNTDAYLAMGLVIVIGILTSYSVSLLVRFNQTHQTIRALESLKDER